MVSPEKCVLSHKDDPYLRLSPLKVEIVAEKPIRVEIFHDLLSEREIKKMKLEAKRLVSQKTEDLRKEYSDILRR